MSTVVLSDILKMGLQSVKEGFLAGIIDQGLNPSPENIPLQIHEVRVFSSDDLDMPSMI